MIIIWLGVIVITKKQWDVFRSSLREVRKTHANVYTRTGFPNNKILTVLGVPKSDDFIYLSENTYYYRKDFKTINQLYNTFYIERSLEHYIKDLKK
jgi:hypothetical protein